MSGRLTTHVLDTAAGQPAAGVKMELRVAGHVVSAVTNADGRCDAPLLAGTAFVPGLYMLTFWVGAYFARTQPAIAEPPFLDEIVLRFGVAAADQHYHVPLLVSPYSYSTYRGS